MAGAQPTTPDYHPSKRCTACQQRKPLAEFSRQARSPDGHRPRCKTCIARAWATQQDAKGRKRQMSAALRRRLGIAPEPPPVEDTLDGKIMRVPLDKGGHAIIDAADWPIIADYVWHVGAGGYAMTNAAIGGKRRPVSMHMLIFGHSEAPEVDHENRNRLDNRRKNLRPATKQQQRFNEGKRTGGTSRFKGVRRLPGGTWEARIQRDGRQQSLGCFASEEDAARAYDAAAKVMFGQFAALNFAT